MALHSYHAQRIYDRLKRWEFRRVHAKIPLGARVLIYESGKVGKITGEFRVEAKACGTPAQVLVWESNERSQLDAAHYLDGARKATALRIGALSKYADPVALADLGVPRAPQSYCRVPAFTRKDRA
jgi:predicted transcriptional regulator